MTPIHYKGDIKIAKLPNGETLNGRFTKGNWYTYWQPSADDMARMIRGEVIRLKIEGAGHPNVNIEMAEVGK